MADLEYKCNMLEITPVLISAGSETKLLGIASFAPRGGVAVGSVAADFTIDLLGDWNCSADDAISMMFGTISRNTGPWTGSCVELESRFNKPLLWYTCRKHIGVLITEKVLNALTI